MAYYNKHLAPGTFAEEFLASEQPEKTLLFNVHLAPRNVRH
jgi:hypothetical protein